jgi:hypothetical protein
MIRKDLKSKKVSITLKSSNRNFEAKVREVDGIGIWIDSADHPNAKDEHTGGQVLIKYEDLASVSIISPLPGIPDLP